MSLAHGALEDRDEQVVLAAEVEVDGAGGDAGGAGDVGHLGVEEAALGEDRDGGAEDGLVLVAPAGGARRRTVVRRDRTPGRADGRGCRQTAPPLNGDSFRT